MNTVQPLVFKNVRFDITDINGQPWLRSPQIAVALGYNRADRINEVYARNADEFTDSMTQLVELQTPGGKQQVRVFSLRGCHLLGMLARTAKAQEFRRWVLDILEKEAQPKPADPNAGLELMMQALVDHAARALPAPAKPAVPDAILTEIGRLLLFAQQQRGFVRRYLLPFKLLGLEEAGQLHSYVHDTEPTFKTVRDWYTAQCPPLGHWSQDTKAQYVQRMVLGTKDA